MMNRIYDSVTRFKATRLKKRAEFSLISKQNVFVLTHPLISIMLHEMTFYKTDCLFRDFGQWRYRGKAPATASC